MKYLVVILFVFFSISSFSSEVVCEVNESLISTPADSRLTRENKYNPGFFIQCSNNKLRLDISNEGLANQFDKEIKGNSREKRKPIYNGIIKAKIKKHENGLNEVISYSWTEINNVKVVSPTISNGVQDGVDCSGKDETAIRMFLSRKGKCRKLDCSSFGIGAKHEFETKGICLQ